MVDAFSTIYRPDNQDADQISHSSDHTHEQRMHPDYISPQPDTSRVSHSSPDTSSCTQSPTTSPPRPDKKFEFVDSGEKLLSLLCFHNDQSLARPSLLATASTAAQPLPLRPRVFGGVRAETHSFCLCSSGPTSTVPKVANMFDIVSGLERGIDVADCQTLQA